MSDPMAILKARTLRNLIDTLEEDVDGSNDGSAGHPDESWRCSANVGRRLMDLARYLVANLPAPVVVMVPSMGDDEHGDTHHFPPGTEARVVAIDPMSESGFVEVLFPGGVVNFFSREEFAAGCRWPDNSFRAVLKSWGKRLPELFRLHAEAFEAAKAGRAAKVGYSERLTSEDQLDMEEAIAAMIFDHPGNEVDEDAAAWLGKEALHLVLRRFRPDLFEDHKEFP